MEEILYESRVYESANDRGTPQVIIYQKSLEKQNSGRNGLAWTHKLFAGIFIK